MQEAEAAQDLTSWPGFASDSGLQLPGSLLTVSEQSVSFGAFPITTAASRLLVLSCGAAVPIVFQWQVGIFSKAAGEVFWWQSAGPANAPVKTPPASMLSLAKPCPGQQIGG